MDVAAAHRPHLARWARSRTVARVCGSQAAFTLNQSFQIIFLATGEATWCCAQTWWATWGESTLFGNGKMGGRSQADMFR